MSTYVQDADVGYAGRNINWPRQNLSNSYHEEYLFQHYRYIL